MAENIILLKKPHQTIKPYIENLTKDKVLIKNERKNITEYSLNIKNKKVYDYLVIAEKSKLLNKLDEDTLLNILFEKLSIFFDDAIFIIFGSASINSLKAYDIDLLIIGKKDVSKIITEFNEVYNKKIHNIQVKDMKDLTNELILEIYKKHLQILREKGLAYEKDKASYFKMPKSGETSWRDGINNKEIIFFILHLLSFLRISSDVFFPHPR